MNATVRNKFWQRQCIVVGLVLVGFLGLCLPTRADKGAPAKKEKTSSVPFELLASNHMVVNAKINGKTISPATYMAANNASTNKPPRKIIAGSVGSGISASGSAVGSGMVS